MTDESLPVSAELTLNPGRERSLRNRHPWIFSGAVARSTVSEPGQLAVVRSANKEVLGVAYVNAACSLLARMVAWSADGSVPDVGSAVAQAVRRAVAFRSRHVLSEHTNGCRLLHGEADGLPGIVADYHAGVVVVASATAGADRLLPRVVDELRLVLPVQAVLERSQSVSRREEKLPTVERTVWGEVPAQIVVKEDGIELVVDVLHGQKTGFFYDHREMRRLCGVYAAGARVLNAFSYSGGFSLHALRGGARSVDSVDVSRGALMLAEESVARGGWQDRHRAVEADVFDFLRAMDQGAYDLIVLDPPAFAKHKGAVREALAGYYEINRQAIEKISTGGILMTFSCSYNVTEEDFGGMVFKALRDAGREGLIISRHRLAADHPVNVFHPEGEYLKGLVVRVE